MKNFEKQKIKTLLSRGDFDDAFHLAKRYYEGSEIEKDIILLSSQYFDWQRKLLIGLDPEQSERNTIILNFLNLIDMSEELNYQAEISSLDVTTISNMIDDIIESVNKIMEENITGLRKYLSSKYNKPNQSNQQYNNIPKRIDFLRGIGGYQVENNDESIEMMHELQPMRGKFGEWMSFFKNQASQVTYKLIEDDLNNALYIINSLYKVFYDEDDDYKFNQLSTSISNRFPQDTNGPDLNQIFQNTGLNNSNTNYNLPDLNMIMSESDPDVYGELSYGIKNIVTSISTGGNNRREMAEQKIKNYIKFLRLALESLGKIKGNLLSISLKK